MVWIDHVGKQHEEPLTLPPLSESGSTRPALGQLVPQANSSLFAARLCGGGSWQSRFSISEGSLPEPGGWSHSEQGVDLRVTADGYAYVRVKSVYATGGRFAIIGHTGDSFPHLAPRVVGKAARPEVAWR